MLPSPCKPGLLHTVFCGSELSIIQSRAETQGSYSTGFIRINNASLNDITENYLTMFLNEMWIYLS
jgi:hypothetical protein